MRMNERPVGGSIEQPKEGQLDASSKVEGRQKNAAKKQRRRVFCLEAGTC